MRTLVTTILVALALSGLGACGGDDECDPDVTPTKDCVCADGSDGLRTCEEGTYSACHYIGAKPDDSCE